MPRIVPSGGRSLAFKDFCIAIANGESAMLLVDSEGQVAPQPQTNNQVNFDPWLHLAQRVGDGWAKPVNVSNEHCHLMVQCMETWFIADRDALSSFFGRGFNLNALPHATNPVEAIEKADVYRVLAAATKDCLTKSPYGKGEHSFKILSLIDPRKVVAASPWAKRFVDDAKRQMGC